jgi:hypothetical protein
MNQGQARRWIEQHFGNLKRFERSERTVLPEEDFIAAFEHIRHFSTDKENQRTALELFLYAGCKRFARWFAPSPPSVPSHYRGVFRAFAEALAQRERSPMNAPIFCVHALRDEVYASFADKRLPLSDDDRAGLGDIDSRLAAISIPLVAEKREEVTRAASDLKAIVDAISAGKLISRLKTSLPYPLTRRPVEFQLAWKGLPIFGRLTSHFAAPVGLITQTMPPNVIRPCNTTRWQYGSTSIELDIPALLDPSLRVPSLQMPAIDVPIDAWPNALRVAFEVIYLACWALRDRPEYVGVWIPAPGDIGDIESIIVIPGHPDIGFIKRGHPSVPFELFTPSSEPVQINLGVATLIAWHQRCRVLAHQYAMFGEMREAVFWLNVGVESLLRSRMEAHIASKGVKLDLDVLDSGTAYWDEAKRLVAAKFPEVAEEIIWPESGQKPSLFRQLKYFCANVPGAPPVGQAQAYYSKVSRKRNALFHGGSESPIVVDDVRAAMAGFNWLAANFCPEPPLS